MSTETPVAALTRIGGTFLASRPLPGVKREGGVRAQHHWQVRAGRATAPRKFRVFIGPGTVNDRMAAISYLPAKDPRGWKMPPDWPGRAAMRELYGTPTPPVVDRLLTETADPPHLLLTTPAANGRDAGDMLRVPDENRPPFFRTAAMWKRELWRALVFITAKPARYSRVENEAHFPVPTVNRRFRVHLGPKLPNDARGVGEGGTLGLADLFLTRQPGRPETDVIHVRQLCFWSLWSANAETYLDLDPKFPPFLIPSLVGLTAGQLGIDLINLFIDQQFEQLAASLETASAVEFWSAA